MCLLLDDPVEADLRIGLFCHRGVGGSAFRAGVMLHCPGEDDDVSTGALRRAATLRTEPVIPRYEQLYRELTGARDGPDDVAVAAGK